MGENAEGKDSSKVLNDSPFDAFANGCFVCISCLCFFFRTVVPNNVARVQNKTGDSVTFKCYDDNDNINSNNSKNGEALSKGGILEKVIRRVCYYFYVSTVLLHVFKDNKIKVM